MKISIKYSIKNSLLIVLSIFIFHSCEEQQSTPQDWPQFKKDNYRSGNSSVELDAATLGEDWVYTAAQMPVPAWYGPAKEDTYANSGPLPSMRDYDLSYYPIIVGDKLYYGSTADDAIHCLDVTTGKELWTFTTGGPIRVAPTFHSGKLYFGSDDGYGYCIKASNGKLVWKFSPSQDIKEKVMNNNSLISFWPVRTGVLVEDEVAYFGASLLPWKDSYFCAVDIKTGKVGRQGTYVQKYQDLTLEGAMASTGTKIIQPQGRVSPMFFNKQTGASNGQLAGTGGCFVLITPEKNIVHPQSSREKGIMETFADNRILDEGQNAKQADFMSFKGGKEMVVKDSISYILTDNSISAYDRNAKKVIWSKRNYLAHRIIISGDMLYVGGTDKVYGVSIKNGHALWEAPVNGTVYALAVANNALFASTGEGHIYKFSANMGNNSLYAENKDKPAVIDNEVQEMAKLEDGNLEFAAGPFINILGPNRVEVHFITEKPVVASLDWGNDYGRRVIKEETPSKEHRIIVEDIRKDFTYQYQLSVGDEKTKALEFDNFFNFTNKAKIAGNNTDESKFLQEIKKLNNSEKGLALVFGGDNKSVAFEIAEHTPLKVIVFETSEDKVKKLREEWQSTGFYGGKITIRHTVSYNALPITSDVANIVVVNTPERSSADEVIRLIKPKGYGVLQSDKVAYGDWLASAKNIWQVSHTKNEVVEVLSKAPHDTAGEWSHQYGLPNNSAFGGESLWGSTTTDDFEIQWMGRPGPRFQTDRSGRKPSPLAVNGKMFVQGRERIIAVDAYNGNVFWSKEIPGLSRMNIIRDCSNWSADDNYLYIAHKQNLLKINNSNGNMANIIHVGESVDSQETDWGYISLLNDKIIGTSIPKGSNYTNYYGGEGWYDKQSGPLAHQVVSFSMFAKKKDGNDNIWVYKKPKSHIINATITITDNQICFVESRNPRFRLSDEGRAGPEIFKNTYLVSLNPDTGKVNWEKPIKIQPGLAAFFMAGSSDRIVIVSSYEGMYYIYNYDSKTGNFAWENQLKWPANHHGAHFSKPAIVGNRLIVKPGIFKLDTGELLEQEVPKAGHGCASYALTEQSAFYRGYSVTQFNFDTDKFTQWERLRPDCWLSTIPAQGMILSPEAGGGCSCGNWLETSMVFAPKSRAPITYLYENEEFMDTLSIEIKTKDGNYNTLFYTLDGSEPTKKSTPYKKPVLINKNTTLKSIIYVDKNGGEASFVRTRNFTRLRPEPTIVELPELNNGKWSFSMERKGNSGEIHFTTDGTTPTVESPKYLNPVVISENTLVKAKTIWKEGNGVLESEENSLEVIIPELIDAVNIDPVPGIVRNYYKNNGKTGNELPDLGELVPKKSDVVNELDLAPFHKDIMYGLRFKGYINIPTDGMYTFSNVTNAAYSTVFLSDGTLLETKPGTEEQSVMLPLKKGFHALTADYFVGNEAQGINLKLKGPNMKNAAIPAALLYHSK